MFGVFVNVLGIVVGAIFGLLLRRSISERLLERLEMGMGYCTILIGVRMAFDYHNILLLLGAVALGGLLGTTIRLTERIEAFAQRCKERFAKGQSGQFAAGFTTCSILYCTGAMAIVGSINAAVLGDHEILIAKSLIDGIISVPLAALYGVGVAFSAIPVFLYQGGLVLFASAFDVLAQDLVMQDVSGVGGVLLLMIGVHLAGIRQVPVGDFIPALFIILLVAPLVQHFA